MLHPQSPWPFERPEQLAEALREQGATPAEIVDLLPSVRRLSEWQAPQPLAAETQRLLARLMLETPAFSPVRQAIRARQRQSSNMSWLLETARAQVSLFGLAFWLVSALVTLLGAVIVLSGALTDQELLLRASGPFLAYLGAIAAFRGTQGRVLECELVCLPTLAQLTIARLVIVLGYDLGLGLALSLALWAGGAGPALTLLLSWFMPLLLVAGLALMLSLRLSIQTAAMLAYGSWLAMLAFNATFPLQALPLTPLSEALLGAVGLALLTIAVLCLPHSIHRLLPAS